MTNTHNFSYNTKMFICSEVQNIDNINNNINLNIKTDIDINNELDHAPISDDMNNQQKRFFISLIQEYLKQIDILNDLYIQSNALFLSQKYEIIESYRDFIINLEELIDNKIKKCSYNIKIIDKIHSIIWKSFLKTSILEDFLLKHGIFQTQVTHMIQNIYTENLKLESISYILMYFLKEQNKYLKLSITELLQNETKPEHKKFLRLLNKILSQNSKKPSLITGN